MLKRFKIFLLPKTLILNDRVICNICLLFHEKSGINWEIRFKELDELVLNYKVIYVLLFNNVNEYLKELQLKGLVELMHKKVSRGENA